MGRREDLSAMSIARYNTVVSCDILWGIDQRFNGNGNRYLEIEKQKT